jgi:periplasmic divalent cation tolerance protein
MDYKTLVVLVTTFSQEVGRQIANILIEKKLAACVNIVSPVNSIYTWEGNVNEDQEALPVIKTRSDLFESRLIPAIRENHPYDVPEIIALPILMGCQGYLNWIEEATAP